MDHRSPETLLSFNEPAQGEQTGLKTEPKLDLRTSPTPTSVYPLATFHRTAFIDATNRRWCRAEVPGP